MTDVQKRKLDLDSEDELFLSYENEKKKRASTENKENSVAGEKEEKTPSKTKETQSPKQPVVNKLIAKDFTTDSPSNKSSSLASGSPAAKSPMIQSKLSFFKPTTAAATQSPKAQPQQQKQPEPIKRANGEWLIEDYLLDEQWRKLLQEEFEKPYFQEINKFIRDGYNKKINRPPKELVFNAYNSTKLSNVIYTLKWEKLYFISGINKITNKKI